MLVHVGPTDCQLQVAGQFVDVHLPMPGRRQSLVEFASRQWCQVQQSSAERGIC